MNQDRNRWLQLAHVAVCARRTGQTVVTSDADDLRRIAPELRLLAV